LIAEVDRIFMLQKPLTDVIVLSIYVLQLGDMDLSAKSLSNQSERWKASPLGGTLRLLNISWNQDLVNLPNLCGSLLQDFHLYEL
jgi:hypothetical protein